MTRNQHGVLLRRISEWTEENLAFVSLYVLCASLASVYIIARVAKGDAGCVLGAVVFLILTSYLFVQASIKRHGGEVNRERHGTKWYWVWRARDGRIYNIREAK